MFVKLTKVNFESSINNSFFFYFSRFLLFSFIFFFFLLFLPFCLFSFLLQCPGTTERRQSWELEYEQSEFLQAILLSSISLLSFFFFSLHPSGFSFCIPSPLRRNINRRMQCYLSNRDKSYFSFSINLPSLVILSFGCKNTVAQNTILF